MEAWHFGHSPSTCAITSTTETFPLSETKACPEPKSRARPEPDTQTDQTPMNKNKKLFQSMISQKIRYGKQSSWRQNIATPIVQTFLQIIIMPIQKAKTRDK